MDNSSARQAPDANIDAGPLPGAAGAFDLHADDNLGDEAAYPSGWQTLDAEPAND